MLNDLTTADVTATDIDTKYLTVIIIGAVLGSVLAIAIVAIIIIGIVSVVRSHSAGFNPKPQKRYVVHTFSYFKIIVLFNI